MRLGLIGPGHSAGVHALAEHFLSVEQADRIVYLGVDGALDAFVEQRARSIVGGDANEAAIWMRAAQLCAEGTPERIDAFLQAHRERERLRMFESLESERAHAVEIIGGQVALLTYDKANLDADDMVPAAFMVFGKSAAPLSKQIGRRWFLSPGPGGMLLDDGADPVRAFTYSSTGEQLESVDLSLAAGVHLTIRS